MTTMTLRTILLALYEGAVFWTFMATLGLLFYCLLPAMLEGK